MAEPVPFRRWRHSRVCISCEEGEVCRCTDAVMSSLWTLNGTVGAVQQFVSDGPYYGTWGSGRTGSITTLEACQLLVEEAIAREPSDA